MTRRSWPAASLLLAGLLLCACSPTTYDESVVTDGSPSPAPTTTAVPSSDPADVLPLMLAEVTDLARRVAEKDDSRAAATRIENLWATVETAVRDSRPDLVTGFEFVVRRCRAAADRNRPADADRARKNLESLVEAYLDH